MEDIIFHSYKNEDEEKIKALIASVGWSESQIEGQLSSLKTLAKDENGYVVVATQGNEILGYISAQFYEWNRLGQIHGLVIHPNKRRNQMATKLVEAVEEFLRGKLARGIYVDTPIDNEAGIKFYEALGYKEAYIMPEYYDKGKDGITYIKFF